MTGITASQPPVIAARARKNATNGTSINTSREGLPCHSANVISACARSRLRLANSAFRDRIRRMQQTRQHFPKRLPRKPRGRPCDHVGSRHPQQRLDDDDTGDDEQQAGQRLQRVTRHDAIVHLHHGQRHDERQKIDQNRGRDDARRHIPARRPKQRQDTPAGSGAICFAVRDWSRPHFILCMNLAGSRLKLISAKMITGKTLRSPSR